jgi:hypothetical protein
LVCRLFAIKNLQEFSESLFHGVGVESILSEAEVWSRQVIVTVRKGHNLRSNHWIAIKILQEFLEAFFHIVDVESILGEQEVWSRQARVMIWKGHNF